MTAGVWTEYLAGGCWRTDADGTVWTIAPDGSGGVALAMRYRDHRLTSRHTDVEAAKRHAADMVVMFAAQSLRDYPAADITAAAPEQNALL